MDFKELWDTINDRVDWFLAGLITLVVLDLVMVGYIGWDYMGQQSFHQKYQISPSAVFVAKAKELEDLPTMDDIEVPPPEEMPTLPKRYVKLQTTQLFEPLSYRGTGFEGPEPGTITSETTGKVVQQKPEIEGFEIVGRIVGGKKTSVSILKRIEDGKTFVAKEGDFLENTDVKVVEITDSVVKLSKPEHRLTTLQFDVDQMSQRMKDLLQQVEQY